MYAIRSYYAATAFNGAIYARVVMVYANTPALCGSYSYGTTIDFKATISGGITSRLLTVTAASTGGYTGSVSSSPTGINTAAGNTSANFADGSTVTLTATSSGSAVFAGWSGAVTSTTNPLSVTMDAAKNITATFAPPVTTPTLTTTTASAITKISAASGGNITNDGGQPVTARGICWNTTGTPTLANSYTTDGSGTGSFTSALSGLSPGTTYYVRAYATNSIGTAYGNQVSFSTLPNNPPVATNDGPFAVNTSETVSGNVLTNDSDVEGDDLDVTAIPTLSQGSFNTFDLETGAFVYLAPTNWAGSFTFAYTVTDGIATANAQATIQVTDNIPPTVTAAENITGNTSDDDTGNCNVDITIPDAAFADNCTGSILSWEMNGAVTDSGSGQIGTYTFPKGTTTITYTVTDAATLTATDVMTVTVTDDENPVVPANGGSTVSCVADAVAPVVPDATDNCDGTIAGAFVSMVDSPSPLTCEGSRVYTYSYTDAAGNVSQWTYTYTIDDNIAPHVTSTDAVDDPDIENFADGEILTFPAGPGSCFATKSIAKPIWADNCSGSVTRTQSANNSVITSYSIHYTKLYEGSADENRTGQTGAGVSRIPAPGGGIVRGYLRLPGHLAAALPGQQSQLHDDCAGLYRGTTSVSISRRPPVQALPAATSRITSYNVCYTKLLRLLLKVEDLMRSGAGVPRVSPGTLLSDALLEISNQGLGMTTVVDDTDTLVA